ncbi:CAP domain-containing protein [Mycolicibacterium sp. P9-64]|uniref:CAP domain-containing protein n=1 Tax=Mycolicibacterium sp. P9-64 TaxID=2024612 RepID=UPI0011EF793C|nr:CAP domain-containing protein [Mycolicibacterium sp. P9-64]KAA0084267.1 CAP domain-containing protein [Mycolicibacterium sp. P9-64]
MARRRIVIGSQLFTTATVFAAAVVFAAPADADAQPPPCGQYGFTGDALLRQGDGLNTSFTSVGTQAAGRAITTGASSPAMGGTVSGGFTAPRHFDLTIRWDDGTVGRYIGDVGSDAKAYGTANGAYFDTAVPLGCVPAQAGTTTPQTTPPETTPLGAPSPATTPPATAPLGATSPAATQSAATPLGATQPVAAPPVATSDAPSEIEALVNDARTHPELYPPRGDTTGAAMAPCAGPFLSSQALADTAAEHNDFLASQPVEWVMTRPHMHASTPDGMQMSTDAGAPIDQAGFHSLRAQIVAMGYPTAAAVVQAWMQDDGGPLNWGHRNIILNCALSTAGAAHLQGGPGGHYWTVNLGNP